MLVVAGLLNEDLDEKIKQTFKKVLYVGLLVQDGQHDQEMATVG